MTTQCQSNVSFRKLTLSYGLVFKEDRVFACSYMLKRQTNTMRNAFKCFFMIIVIIISESPNWVAVGLLKIQNVSAKRNILVKDKQTMQHSDFRSTQPFTVSVCVSVFVHVPHTGIVTSLAKLVPVCRARTTASCAYFPLKGPSMYNRVCKFCHMLCYSSCFSKL